MPRSLDALADWVRSRPLLRRGARVAVRLIPDIPWTKRVPTIGPIRFRLRQYRWFLWEEFAKNDGYMLGVFDRLVRPGDTVYDIGANIGIYTRMLAAWFHTGRIIAIEPMHQNVEMLEANVELGQLKSSVTVLGMAASDIDGEADLQIDDVRSTTAVLDTVSGGKPSEGRRHFDLPPLTERVTVARLDTIVRTHELPPPDVIKIDTEGAEALVIAGGRETLTAHRPRLAIATHGPDKADATIEALRTLEYHCYGFVLEHGNRVYRALVPGDGAVLANNNIIASCDEADVSEPLVNGRRGPRPG